MSIEAPICVSVGCGQIALRARDGLSAYCHDHLVPSNRMSPSEAVESMNLHNAAYVLERDKEIARVWFELGKTNPNTFDTLWAAVQKIREDL